MGARPLAALVLSVGLATAGCASLEINSWDSGQTKFAKVLGRTVLGVATIGFSELNYAGKRAAAKRRATLNSWIGHGVNELIGSWGPPTSTTEGFGGVISFYTWTRSWQTTTQGKVKTTCNTDTYGTQANTNCISTVTPATTRSNSRSTTFTIDSSGRITGWSTR